MNVSKKFFVMKPGYDKNGVVRVSDTPPTRTHERCVHDAVSNAFLWARYDLLSGHAGKDAVHSLTRRKGRDPLFKHIFHTISEKN